MGEISTDWEEKFRSKILSEQPGFWIMQGNEPGALVWAAAVQRCAWDQVVRRIVPCPQGRAFGESGSGTSRSIWGHAVDVCS